MNDLDPTITRALDALSPAGPAAPEWSGLAPSPRRSRGRLGFVLLLLAVAGLAILLASPAFGLRHRIQDLLFDTTPEHPASQKMSVFDLPRTENDVLPPHVRYRLARDSVCTERIAVTFGGCVGKGLGGESRLLLSGLGVRNAKLWGWPTDTGAVCWAWDEGAGGCVLDWDFNAARGYPIGFMGIDPDELREGAPGTLVGVVPDDVVRVDLVVAGTPVRTRLERNGVFYELPSPRCVPGDIEELRVTFADGTVQTDPTGWSNGARQDPGVCRP